MKYSVALLFFLFFSFAASAFGDTSFITTSDSVKLFVERSGKGVPVLFIHGGPGSNSGYFQLGGGRMFESEVELIYLDQRGCGRSGNAANNNYSLKRMILDMEEVRLALGIKQWILMPHSFGGIIATAYAQQYPASVKAMVYLNATVSITSSATSGLNKTKEILLQKGIHLPDLYNDSIPLLTRWGTGFGKLQELGLFDAMMFASKENFQKHDSITLINSKTWEFSQRVWNYNEYFADFIPATKSIHCPVLIIGGTKDYTIGIKHPDEMQFPNAVIRYVEGGHALYFENPKQLFHAVEPFLKEQSK